MNQIAIPSSYINDRLPSRLDSFKTDEHCIAFNMDVISFEDAYLATAFR
jgi:hypothetical protein